MEKIEHKFLEINGLKHHFAETGSESSTTMVFLHGFPEIWYSWRHQMIAVAKAGFRAIAPDFRGYGLSEPKPEPETTTFMELDSDLLALLDALSLSKVYLVGKDFGAFVISIFSLLHKDRVLGFVTMGVPFMLPELPPYQLLPEGFYISRFQKPGRAEADFGRLDAKTVVKNVYILFSKSEIPIANENQEIMDLVEPSAPQPYWLTAEDLEAYGALYEKSGFATALRIPYRSLGKEDFGISDPKVDVPALLIMGEKDYLLNFPGIEDYIRDGTAKHLSPIWRSFSCLTETILYKSNHLMRSTRSSLTSSKVISDVNSSSHNLIL